MKLVEKEKREISVPVDMPKVLILLATYNAGPWLKEQLNSILSQEDVEVHVLIGDDQSKDGTRDLIDFEWKEDARVELIVWDSPSGSAGGNFRRLYRCADASRYDYIAFADQDDVWLSNKLITAVRALQKQNAAGYSCSVESFWPNGNRKIIKQCGVVRHADFLFEGGGQGCTFVITRSLFLFLQDFCRKHVSLADAMHYHDWLVYLLARTSGLKWYFDEMPYMCYRQHSGNEIGSRGNIKAIGKRLDLIKNGWYRGQVNFALNIVAQLNYKSEKLTKFANTYHSPRSQVRQILIAWFMLVHGRRKLSDRIVLAATALAGWI
ncbi:glycosyltransferase [Massilia forsythiae]|uniref:Glycosyltransferase n=1 Tax=Massilia forsythiae TaxID=2728020 RepID=A0A7Z2VXG5_9BURK|nr:glycosyltransferase [Massilia forsythiae]QJE00899.1 glycosyltransferase [Massilia forsythiae]